MQTPDVSTAPVQRSSYAQNQYANMMAYDKVYGRIFVFVPIIGVFTAIVLAFNGHPPGALEWVLFAAMYLFTTFGIEVGYHRCFAHRAFAASPGLEVVLAVAGTMAWSGSLPWWVATHRRHHRFVDTHDDPHTPNRDRSSGGASLRSFLYGYIGWLLDPPQKYPIGWQDFSKDLYKNPRIFAIYIHHLRIVAVSAIVPAAIGALAAAPEAAAVWTDVAGSTLMGALMALLWGCLLPVFVTQHAFMLINSWGHRFGGRPNHGRTIGQATNSWWLAMLSMGQGWHNNHHDMPAAATTSQAWWQFDPGAVVIRCLEKAGWARDVRWPSVRATMPADD
jgi:stearoyl-CoA desaturase (Delta-9 desaturase)